MSNVFVNYTNHASAAWSKEQTAAAEAYGPIVDMPFPEIPPEWTAGEVETLARKTAGEILPMKPAAVLCQGEFTYTYCLVGLLKQAGCTVLAACSRRVVQEALDDKGVIHKNTQFRFVQFRAY